MPPRRGLRPRSQDKDVLRPIAAEDVCYLGGDNMTRFNGSGFCFSAVLLASLFLLSGCASSSASAVNSYAVPSTVDLKLVMDIVEQSTAQVLGSPVTMIEGTMPSVLPFVASPALVERRHRVLDGLGRVTIPHIHCPGSIATMEKLLAGNSGLRIVAACISPTRTGTFIQLVEADGDEARRSTPAAASSEPSKRSTISSVGRLLLERLSGSHSAGSPAAVTEVGRYLPKSHLVVEEDEIAESMQYKEQEQGTGPLLIAVPLVCFVPRTESISVRTGPDDRITGDTINAELIVDVESPVNTGYVHVETREGGGWVKRSDLRRQPCPIG